MSNLSCSTPSQQACCLLTDKQILDAIKQATKFTPKYVHFMEDAYEAGCFELHCCVEYAGRDYCITHKYTYGYIVQTLMVEQHIVGKLLQALNEINVIDDWRLQ